MADPVTLRLHHKGLIFELETIRLGIFGAQKGARWEKKKVGDEAFFFFLKFLIFKRKENARSSDKIALQN